MATSEPGLSSAERSKIRRLVRAKSGEAEAGGDLNVVPYLDIVLNIVLFVLGSLSVVFVSSIDVRAPEIGSGTRPPVEARALRLTALVTAEGVSLKTSGGNVAPGCTGLGAGLAVPARAGRHDFAAITACARRLKDSSPAFAEETQVTLTADPGIDTQTVIDVMDALRGDARGPLFADVGFGVVR